MCYSSLCGKDKRLMRSGMRIARMWYREDDVAGGWNKGKIERDIVSEECRKAFWVK